MGRSGEELQRLKPRARGWQAQSSRSLRGAKITRCELLVDAGGEEAAVDGEGDAGDEAGGV
jgi:hypothetical protein